MKGLCFRFAAGIVCTASLLFSMSSFAGPGSGGGGDQFVVDYLKTAYGEAYKFLKQRASDASPAIDAEAFRNSIDATKIVSAPVVYESCDSSRRGRQVAACFNPQTGFITLSRAMYPVDQRYSSSKISLILHEQFRKMGLEGDQYELTKKLRIGIAAPDQLIECLSAYSGLGFALSEGKDICARTNGTGSDPLFEVTWSYIEYLQMDRVSALSTSEKTNGSNQVFECAYQLHEYAHASAKDAIETCTQ